MRSGSEGKGRSGPNVLPDTGYAGGMGWVLLFLVLIAAAFGVLGMVIKATLFIVLTVVLTVIALGYIGYLLLRRQARRFENELNKRLQPPGNDPRY